MSVDTAMPDEILAFLAEKGYDLVPGHFKGFTGGYASGDITGVHSKDEMKNFEIWHLGVCKIGNPKSARGRVVYRPTKTGLRVEWGDDPND